VRPQPCIWNSTFQVIVPIQSFKPSTGQSACAAVVHTVGNSTSLYQNVTFTCMEPPPKPATGRYWRYVCLTCAATNRQSYQAGKPMPQPMGAVRAPSATLLLRLESLPCAWLNHQYPRRGHACACMLAWVLSCEPSADLRKDLLQLVLSGAPDSPYSSCQQIMTAGRTDHLPLHVVASPRSAHHSPLSQLSRCAHNSFVLCCCRPFHTCTCSSYRSANSCGRCVGRPAGCLVAQAAQAQSHRWPLSTWQGLCLRPCCQGSRNGHRSA
jgi:hypothetical protein